jgi:SOS-response transcriptional repressor LexA
MHAEQNISARLAALSERYDLGQAELARELGLSVSYVHQLLNGKRTEPSAQLLKLLDLYEKMRSLQSSTPAPLRLREESGTASYSAETPLTWLPVISWAHAGEATDFEELPSHMQERIPVTCRSPNAFALRIEGDSMEPRCVNGDLVVVMPGEEPRNGCLVVARLSNDGVVLRRFTKLPAGRVRLTAYNPVYPAIDYEADEFRWIYPVHSTIRREWS